MLRFTLVIFSLQSGQGPYSKEDIAAALAQHRRGTVPLPASYAPPKLANSPTPSLSGGAIARVTAAPAEIVPLQDGPAPPPASPPSASGSDPASAAIAIQQATERLQQLQRRVAEKKSAGVRSPPSSVQGAPLTDPSSPALTASAGGEEPSSPRLQDADSKLQQLIRKKAQLELLQMQMQSAASGGAKSPAAGTAALSSSPARVRHPSPLGLRPPSLDIPKTPSSAPAAAASPQAVKMQDLLDQIELLRWKKQDRASRSEVPRALSFEEIAQKSGLYSSTAPQLLLLDNADPADLVNGSSSRRHSQEMGRPLLESVIGEAAPGSPGRSNSFVSVSSDAQRYRPRRASVERASPVGGDQAIEAALAAEETSPAAPEVISSPAVPEVITSPAAPEVISPASPVEVDDELPPAADGPPASEQPAEPESEVSSIIHQEKFSTHSS